MQWTMSKKLYEAPRKRSIRGTSQPPRRSAYLWSGMVNPKLREDESVRETSICKDTSKRRYGVQMEGNSSVPSRRVKSRLFLYECLWLFGYKPSTSIEGARSEKIGDQIHKATYPVTGCSGDLNPTVTVHHVNVGTSCFGCREAVHAITIGGGVRMHTASTKKVDVSFGKGVMPMTQFLLDVMAGVVVLLIYAFINKMMKRK